MNMNIRQDYSFLFSSLNNSNKNANSIYNINLADYASIKNGSYGKSLKAYYKELKKDQTSSSDKNDKTDKNNSSNKTDSTNKTDTSNKTESTNRNDSATGTTTTDTSAIDSKKQELTTLQKNADELQVSANKLLQKGSASLFKSEYETADKEALYKAVSDFVSKFNAVYANGTASSVDSLARMSGRLGDSASDNKDALGAIGISMDEKNGNKLVIDKESFMNADMDQVQKLFNDSESFGYFVSQRAKSIEDSAASEANLISLYTKLGTYSNMSAGTLYTGTV